MFKRRNSQGEEEGTFNVLHIIPLIFYPFLLFFFHHSFRKKMFHSSSDDILENVLNQHQIASS